MKLFYTFFLTMFTIFSNAQVLDCDDFEFNISSDFYTKIELVNNKEFNSLLKDSISLSRNTNKNLDSLQKEFDKNYKNKITTKCINSKVYNEQDRKVINYNECNNRQKIELVDKINNYYVFNLKAFEINDYLLFNTLNETIYVIDDYPIISDNGNTIFTLKFHTPNSHGANVYKFEGEKLNRFRINFSGFYNLKSYYVTKSWNNKSKILINLIKHESIRKENEIDNTITWTDNKDKFCSKFIVISP
ncbi:hypothetical protein [Algoriella sp.]|uniref:hypothetical protein n=1 Tax=Algoriella sp. TaxID=1872434 RepID=UPI001B27B927|nr:hypothetical protein [Algoriella sp.]MBO6211627.1 hypothetical protein [Algoriella sp.]